MTTSEVTESRLPIDPSKNTTELAVSLTEFELNNGIISADNGTEELSSADRFKQRLERFGKIAPEAKKISRALRFGTSHEAIDGTAKKRRLERFGAIPHSAEDEQQKKRQRVDRFHVNNSSSRVDEEIMKKRIDRFGVVTPSTTSPKKTNADDKSAILSDAVKKRVERFGDVSQTAMASTLIEQKAKRAGRFKPTTNS